MPKPGYGPSICSPHGGQIAYNVILDIEHPVTMTALDRRIVRPSIASLNGHEADPVSTVAATHLPRVRLPRNGVKGVFEDFPNKRIRSSARDGAPTRDGSLRHSGKNGKTFNPLEVRSRSCRAQANEWDLCAASTRRPDRCMTDLPIFDPGLDSKRNQGQPCLAHFRSNSVRKRA